MILADFLHRGIAPLQFRSRPLWELNQVGSSLPRSRFHLTETTWALSMGYILPWVPFEFQDETLPLFEDPAADGIRSSMPECNEYRVAGTTKVEPPPVPKTRSLQGGRPREQSLAHGDVSPEEPGTSDDEGDEVTPPGVPCGRGGPGAPSGAATNKTGDELPEQPVPPSSPSLQESDQVSEAILLPLQTWR